MPLLTRVIILLTLALTLCAAARAADDPLPPEEAYRFSARAIAPDRVEVRFEIADGYYLYRDKFRFMADPESVQLGAAELPPGKRKHDEFFGDVEIYRGTLTFPIPITAPDDIKAFTLTGVSQGCWDGGVCYPPTEQPVRIDLTASTVGDGGSSLARLFGLGEQAPRPLLDTPPPGTAPAASSAPPAPVDEADANGDESSRIAGILRGGSLPLVIASFFGFGLLMAFTPCTFPMIPILSGIIVGHGHHISRARALGLSLAYVMGMALTYAAAGIAAGMSGTLLAAALQNVWVLTGFALVFVLLALSMFGFYELQLPTALQSRLSESASHQRGGRLGGVAAMGALSALIVGPCMAAPLAGALLYIAKTGDATLGGIALFVLALGMGVPLMVVGVAARSALPHAGPWMEGVKKAFGVILLAVAVWLVTPVIPPTAVMLAWAALLIFSAIYLRALDPLPPAAHGGQRCAKAVGVLALLAGAAMLVGALAGSRDPLQPLAVLRAGAASAAGEVRFETVRSVEELDARLAATQRPVMLDFYADWCVSCKEMERFTFTDPAVRARMDQMLLLKADVTANSAADAALLKRYSLFGPPGIIFFDARGGELGTPRVVGYQPAAQFAAVLDRVLTHDARQ
jgi:thiol:disulfide interchange protein DsbD